MLFFNTNETPSLEMRWLLLKCIAPITKAKRNITPAITSSILSIDCLMNFITRRIKIAEPAPDQVDQI